MKTIFLTAISLAALSANAHEIEGTLVLKGSIKSKVMVRGIKTTCKAKVEKVKNLMEEDSYGNPAYKVQLEISLDGNDYSRGISIDHEREYTMINLFGDGRGTIVKDLEYFSKDGASMRIDEEGRITSVQFSYGQQKISCSF